MLNRKAIRYRERELPPVGSRWLLPRLGFKGNSVPAIAAGPQRVQGTRSISRWLERVQPAPALFPSDHGLRDAVVNAEAWGDEVLQDVVRRVYLWGLSRDRPALKKLAAISVLPAPGPLGPLTARIAVRRLQRMRGVTDSVVRHDLAELPALLDRVDGWIDQGVLGRDEPNAADHQLAPSLAVLIGMQDLRPMVESHPASQLASRFAPHFPAYLSRAVLPAPRARETAGTMPKCGT